MASRFQFVWWGWRNWSWPSFGKVRGSLAAIYRWSAQIGPLEIRRWTEFSMNAHHKKERDRIVAQRDAQIVKAAKEGERG